jgi:2',3'-cyclic-nucleotide 2'-phosphodiesterase (5'-nucleotidase family)
MNNRRKFLVHTTLASVAVAFLNPLKSIAIVPSCASSTLKTISILNIAGIGKKPDIALEDLKEALEKEDVHSLLLATGNVIDATTGSPEQHLEKISGLQKLGLEVILPGSTELAKGGAYYDGLMSQCNLRSLCSHSNERALSHLLPYHIVRKGQIKVGVIGNYALDKNLKATHSSLKELSLTANETAAHLKEQHECNLIIFMQNDSAGEDKMDSRMYKNLATLTRNIDVIVSTVEVEKHGVVYVAKNIDEHDVIVNFAPVDYRTPRKRIEITYNNSFQKTNVSVSPVV